MQVKALTCKEEATCEHDPESLLSSLGQRSFKVDLGKVENSSEVREIQNLNFSLVIMDAASAQLKSLACYQSPAQKPASLMRWACMGAYGTGILCIWKGTINAERYRQVLEQHMLPSRIYFSKEDFAYFSKTEINLYCIYYNSIAS